MRAERPIDRLAAMVKRWERDPATAAHLRPPPQRFDRFHFEQHEQPCSCCVEITTLGDAVPMFLPTRPARTYRIKAGPIPAASFNPEPTDLPVMYVPEVVRK